MRSFGLFDGNFNLETQGDILRFDAEQISAGDDGTVQFYNSAVDGNSRKMVAVVKLKPGQSIREIKKGKK